MKKCILVHAFTALATVVIPTALANNDLSFLSPSGPSSLKGGPNPIGENVTCNVEDVEQANDSQLHVILSELQSLEFFKHFVVDLQHQCPLTATKIPSSLHSDDSASEELEEEEEFECTGGSLEDDPDAEPACTVDLGDDAADSLFALGDLESNALNSLQQDGFSSPQQAQSFEWKKQTDMVVVEEDCNDEDDEVLEDGSTPLQLPDTFWMDICASIKQGDGTTVVNLAKNPERNTGYDGQHIWRAIYEENCIQVSKGDEEMCFEERVLYRLLSGLHTSTTVSIANHYYAPSKKRGRADWEPNPQFFMEKLGDHPEYIRNLHFSYVFMLRALRKASTYLSTYPIQSGNAVEDKAAQILLQRLLDSTLLRSCSSVFSAFDESLMFDDTDSIVLQQNFKGVFHNISSILDCVQCQQCKLHGKMAMLGYGTALKMLFVPLPNLTLERNEVVAFINTLARLSESMITVRHLTAHYWELERDKVDAMERLAPPDDPSLPTAVGAGPSILPLMDITIGLISKLRSEGFISKDRESELVELAIQQTPELLILSKYYSSDLARFLELSSSIGKLGHDGPGGDIPDVVVVGSGLAGMAATLNVLDRGGRVVLVEKEHLLGGNSNKASSGINGCCNNETSSDEDTVDIFGSDTTTSAGTAAHPELISTLVENSASALKWLQERVGVDLSQVAQLGGHSQPRTHRPSNGMAGAEIMFHIQRAVRAYEKTGQVQILVDHKVTDLVTDDATKQVLGVRVESTLDGAAMEIVSHAGVILATGGFASDRSPGSYLVQHRPELVSLPATAGAFSTGDGITLATSLGAGVRDMDQIQIHPTGWVNPEDPTNPSKILAAELMRGVGGILLNDQGKRFCNELGTRAYVTKKMFEQAPEDVLSTNGTLPTFHLLLSSSAAANGKKHVDLYSHKGLLKPISGLTALARHTGLPIKVLGSTLREYQRSADQGKDAFGKTVFRGMFATDLENETFYVGQVTPVLHYCMGGITIDNQGNVLRADQTPIHGLYAAGEVTGGVHGNNRLGGNSLLECTVYGSIVGKGIPIHPRRLATSRGPSTLGDQPAGPSQASLPEITLDELAKHNSADDLWIAIHGVVYDFTGFPEEHPGGVESVLELAGKDGTTAFAAVHNMGLLDDFEDDKKGILVHP